MRVFLAEQGAVACIPDKSCTNNATSLSGFFSESRITATSPLVTTNWLFALRISFYSLLLLFTFNLPTTPNELKTKLQGLKNYTLESATATSLGGFMVGAELSMTGDSLNAAICNVFEGATATESSDVGLIPAPKSGEQQRFLCSDGTWKIPPAENINVFASGYTPDAMAVDILSYSSGVMTLEALSSPPDTKGTLYMGIAQDECCLKLFSGDYEYTFNPDVFELAECCGKIKL